MSYRKILEKFLKTLGQNFFSVRINFFCEFPEEELEAAKYIDFPSTIVIAAENQNKFNKYRENLEQINPDLDAAYWPTVESTYWPSAFSELSDIERISEEVQRIDAQIFLDIEPPLLTPKRFLSGLRDFRKKKKLIRTILEEDNLNEISSARELLWLPLATFMGLNNEKDPVWMFYSSQAPIVLERIIKWNLNGLEDVSYIGLGCLDTGILGDEDILSPDQLDSDLRYSKRLGVEEVFLFRLSAINKDKYRELIRGYPR